MATEWQDGRMTRSTNTQFAVAVHVLTYLAGIDDGRPASSEELSRSTNVNAVYIRRVMGPLRSAGLVRSRPGVHGGWELALDPSQTSLDQVWLLLQGTDPVLGLHGPNPQCPVGRDVQAALIDIDAGVARAVRAELAGRTIGDVVATGGPPRI